MADRPILYLHVGRDKTGTSALQHAMRTLPPAHLLYPETGRWADGAHHVLAFALQGVARHGSIEIPPLPDLLDRLRSEIRAMPDRDVLISSEILYAPQLGMQMLARLRAALPGHFGATRVVLVYRDHLEYAKSLYTQVVKDPVHGESRDPDAFLADPYRFAYRGVIEQWQASGERIELISYHPRETYMDRMFAAIGAAGASHANEMRNTSLAPLTTLAMLIVNRLVPDQVERHAWFDKVRRHRDFRRQKIDGTSYFTRYVAVAFHEALAADREFVAAHIGSGEIPSACRPDLISLDEAQAETLLDYAEQIPGFNARRDEFAALVQRYVGPRLG